MKNEKQIKQAWESKSLGSHFQHNFFYLLLRLGGLKAGNFLLFWVVLYYSLAPYVRRRIIPYLEKVFGPANYFRRTIQVFKIYWQFGLVLLERAAAGIMGTIEAEGADYDNELVQNALEKGNGLIMLSAHIGAWQTAMSGLGFTGKTVYVVHKRIQEDIDKHYFEHEQKNKNITQEKKLAKLNFIDPTETFGGMIAMRHALKHGGVLCLMGDRLVIQEKITVPVTFLGETIWIPGTPYLLASVTASPIAVVFTLRSGICKARGITAQIFEVPPHLPHTPEAIQPYAQKFANAMESVVRDNPYEYFNFYDIWKKHGVTNE